jgi:D-alanine--D-alanine ligase
VRPLRIALLVGGPSPERAVSLNSARSLADHLHDDTVAVEPIVYFDRDARPFAISRAMLYSNTPDDFDFKLAQVATPLDDAALAAALAGCDLAFPAMHGRFGEDGGVQSLLERLGVPLVGTASAPAAVAYDKQRAHEALRAAGVPSVPTLAVAAPGDEPAGADDDRAALARAGDVVVKPAAGGSSLDVHVVAGGLGAARAVLDDVAARRGTTVVQPRVRGTELTVVVLEGTAGPVALPPVEVELVAGAPGHDDRVLTYRHKYLASDDARYHCPPRAAAGCVDELRALAERTFRALGLRDVARIDCWLTDGGELLVSDVNPISGMEQNSFLFIAAAQAGLSHRDVLRFVVAAACRRAGVEAPTAAWAAGGTGAGDAPGGARRRVPVLFGGRTAERQVSVLSGTNVWLKLLRSPLVEPVPHLLAPDGAVWVLPYAAALRHSVEQIVAVCEGWAAAEPLRRRLAADVAARLALAPWQRTLTGDAPVRTTLDGLLDTRPAFVFLALHGGTGEDGTVQAMLEARAIAYNGSGPEASRCCADKLATAERLAGLEGEGILTSPKRVVALASPGASDGELWRRLTGELGAPRLVGKPTGDGCSAGVAPLASAAELGRYLGALRAGERAIPPGTFSSLDALQVVELPTERVERVLFEPFVETDDVVVGEGAPGTLRWGEHRHPGWIEVTVGVLGPEGAMRALQPSATVARAGVLSVEEKFMGGTGVNITPPPPPPLGRVPAEAVAAARARIERVAGVLGLRGYARIDAFLECATGRVLVIEANTLPGLSPSTVLYHQALAEDPPLFPRQLLERIIELGLAARRGAEARG